MNPGDSQDGAGAPRRNATVLESAEEIRRVLNRRSDTVKESVGAAPAPQAPAPASPDAQSFRPSSRPPMATVCVHDDGDDVGEVVRVRACPFVIGRVDGDLLIPHDNGMSGRHAEITRRFENGDYFWYLKDLQSTNGTFVRVANVVLNTDQEVIIGSRRFRFEVMTQPPEPAPGPQANATRKWEVLSESGPATILPPSLVDVTQGQAGRRFALTGQEHWLGRDAAQCTLVVDDPMIDRKHAKVARDGKNRWVITNARSVNGLWARVHEIGLGRGAFFQCGEQRFFFKAL